MSRTPVVVLPLTLLALSGCAHLFPHHEPGAGNTKHEPSFIVTAEHAAFYRRVPKATRPPDLQLAKDTLVAVIRPAFAYSKVRLANGEQGFVANEDITRASDNLVAETDTDTGSDSEDSLPATPEVTLPSADSSPEAGLSSEPLLPAP